MDDGARKLQEKFRASDDDRLLQIFGGAHIVVAGDFAQHQPPVETPIFQQVEDIEGSRNMDQSKLDKLKQGRRIWKQINQCFMLKEQHRFSESTESGRELFNIVQLLMSNVELSDKVIGELVDKLNGRYPSTPEVMRSLLLQNPKTIVLRNKLKPSLNLLMYKIHASNDNQRLIVWNCKDSDKGSMPKFKSKSKGKSSKAKSSQPPSKACTTPVSSYVAKVLAKMASKDTGDMPTQQFFYPGIEYKFIDNDNPGVGRINNNTCIGKHIVLDDREPDDTGDGEFWQLKYLPKYVFVHPSGHNVGDLHADMVGFEENLLTDCIAIQVKQVCFPLHFTDSKDKPHDVPLHANGPRCKFKVGNKINILRFGIPLDGAMAVTDYFAQGVSFKKAIWLLHLKPPSSGKMSKANLLVPITRPSLFSDLWLLAPLYTNEVERLEVIRRYKLALKPNDHYIVEMKKLELMSEESYKLYEDCTFDLLQPLPNIG